MIDLKSVLSDLVWRISLSVGSTIPIIGTQETFFGLTGFFTANEKEWNKGLCGFITNSGIPAGVFGDLKIQEDNLSISTYINGTFGGCKYSHTLKISKYTRLDSSIELQGFWENGNYKSRAGCVIVLSEVQFDVWNTFNLLLEKAVQIKNS